MGYTFEVCAGAECSALPCYDSDAETRFVIEPGPERPEFFVASCIDAVELFRAGEGDKEDAGGGEGDFGEGRGGRLG